MDNSIKISEDLDKDLTRSDTTSLETQMTVPDTKNTEEHVMHKSDTPAANINLNDDQYTENTDENSVNTNDCAVVIDKKITKNMYLENLNFDHNIKASVISSNDNYGEDNEEEDSNIPSNSSSMHQSWLPSILKGESWPDNNDNFISDDVEEVKEIDNNKDGNIISNPLMSVRETVLWKNDTNAREAANWKKYKEDNFFNMIRNNKLKDIPSNESTIPNTFANKFNKLHNSNLNPDSPLKLFGANPNTYTKFKINNMLNQLSPRKSATDEVTDTVKERQLPNVMKQSDELYNRIITGTSSNNDLLSKARENMLDIVHPQEKTEKIQNNVNDNEDLTSDAEEFSSFPSTTKKFVRDGEQLFENLRDGYQQRLPLANMNASQSDYTSADDYDVDGDGDNGDKKEMDNNYTNNTNDELSDNLSRLEIPSNTASTGSIETMRNQLMSQAEQFNSEFNISPPKLQSQYRAIEEKENIIINNKGSLENKPKGLNFIPADDYKNKIYDKKLKKFVFKNEYDTNSSYTESENSMLDNLSVSDPDKTSNSILRNNNNDIKLKEVTPDQNMIETKGNYISDDDSNVTIDESVLINQSYAVSEEILVQAINETYPIDDWNCVRELDLSEFRLKQLYNLDKMTPNIWYLNASNNEIQQNFGIPKRIQVLNLSFNKFNNLSSKFDRFQYLQILNLSNNKLEDLRCLKELINLTSLNLSFNQIENIEYLENFKMLHYLNLSNNKINGFVNFRNYTLWFLEDLIIDNNEIEGLINISELPALINLSGNNNNIKKFEYVDNDEDIILHLNLKRICLNNNELNDGIDLYDYPNLKEIQIDRSFIRDIQNVCKNVEKISCRYGDNGEKIENIFETSLYNSNLKKLYLTGGKLCEKLPNFKFKFSSLNILDLSAMNLKKLPDKFSEFFPILNDLNLNFNKIKNLKGLEGLKHLKQMKLLGNEIENIEDIIEFTSNLRMNLKLIDLRVNPLTSKFYPFIFYGEEDDEEEEEKGKGKGKGKQKEEIENDVETEVIRPFQLQENEDIEAFSIEYSHLYETEGLARWAVKNRKHQRKLSRKVREEKNEYLMELLVWFEHVKFVDGDVVNEIDRRVYVSSFGDDRRGGN